MKMSRLFDLKREIVLIENKVNKADEAGLLKESSILNLIESDTNSKSKGFASKFYKKIPLLSAHKFGLEEGLDGTEKDARFSCDCQVRLSSLG